MTEKKPKTWPGGPFWDRIVKITGEDDPGRLVHLTGLSYSQLTRYRDGKAGKRGPGATDLQRATAVIRETRRGGSHNGAAMGSRADRRHHLESFIHEAGRIERVFAPGKVNPWSRHHPHATMPTLR